jgi:predicted MFS family arabinose efflux permease
MTTVAPEPARAPRGLLFVLMLAGLTVSVQSTLGTPLIPTISAEQGVSLETAQWMLTITLLVGAVATPVLGRLGDGPQRRTVLLATLACGMLGSIAAATAGSFPQLLVGRGLQGIGYGTVPLCIALAREYLRGDQQRSAIAALSITVAVGAGLGFPVTGLIAQLLDVHAAFWFGALFAAFALIGIYTVVPRSDGRAAKVSLDIPGAVLLGVGLGVLLLGISNGEGWGWASPRVIGCFAGAIVVLGAWVVVELNRAAPLVDLRLVSQRAILSANIAAILIAMGMYMAISLVNRFSQTPRAAGYGFGATLVVAGLLLLPLSAGSLLSQPITRAATARFGTRVVLPVGALVVAGTELMLTIGDAHMGWVALATALLGIGIGATFAAMPALIVANVPPERTGSATSLNQVLRSVGGALGSATAATILASHHQAGTILPPKSGYTTGFAAAAGICVVAAIITFVLTPAMQRGRASAETELLMEESSVALAGPSVFDGESGRR